MVLKQLFLSDVLKQTWCALKENFWYLCLVEFVYYFLESVALIISGVVSMVILLPVGFHKMLRQILQEYTQIQADSALPQSQKVAHFLSGALHVMGDSLLVITGAIALFFLCFLIFSYCFSLGYKKIMLNLYDGKPAPLSLFFTSMVQVPSYFVAWLVYTLMVLMLLPLLIIPGLVAMVVFGFYMLFIVDNNTGPIESLKNSYRITRGHVVRLTCWIAFVAVMVGFASVFVQWIMTLIFSSFFPYAILFVKLMCASLSFWFLIFFNIVLYRQLLQERSEVAVGEAEFK